MKKITLIHTVPMVIEMLNKKLKEAVPSIVVENIMDDHILNLVKTDEKKATERLQNLVDLAEKNGDGDIIITCSSLSEISKKISNKVVMIDSFMHDEAIKYKKILLAATAESAIEPTKVGIERKSDPCKISKKKIVIDGAIEAFKSGDKEKHDTLVLDAIERELKKEKYDAVILCQASMAHLKEGIEELGQGNVLTNVDYFINYFRGK